jgi:5-methylthioadenosine/S-adenosylhomocysteine deaminase
MSGDLLIRGGTTIDSRGSISEQDVLVREGAIAELGPGLDAAGAEVLDASHAYVLPGLVNAHYHSGENFNPGLYENLPLDLWFIHSHQVTRAEPPSRDAIYARTMLGATLMLRNGVTCVVDFLFEAPEISIESLEPVVAAYRDAGMRATILLGVADKLFADSLPLTAQERARWTDEVDAPSLSRIKEVATEAVERWHEPGGLIQIGMGPSAPQRCSDELLAWSLDLCRERGLAWQTHVLETKTQAMTAREWHGKSFVELLAERGQLDSTSTLVHTVWLSELDIRLMAEHGVTAAHCPMSNLRLGDGVAPVPAMQRAGINVALGTDGRGCDESLDVLELARVTSLLNKARGADHHEWLSAHEAFRMATANGSAPAGHGHALGRIEPGARADLVVVPADIPALVPLHDPLRQLVLGANGRDVRDVVVDGRVVVRDAVTTGVDEAQALASARRYAEAEFAAAPVGDEESRRLEQLLGGLMERTRSRELEIDSYLPPLPS